jgi:chorismate synthase
MMLIRPLTTIDECRQVAALEREIWGFPDGDDVVPATLLIVSVKRGGILLGGFDAAGGLKGFVYSMPAVKDGRLTQWSHMLGVSVEARGSGLAARLKLAQREAALLLGIDLIEWTFDPLQALNAHFNLAKLGAVAGEYEENVYGQSASPLHVGTPTDRLVAEWRITLPHVERRIAAWGQPVMRDSSLANAPVINPAVAAGEWLVPGPADLSRETRRLLVEIPVGFSEMQTANRPLALEWRVHTREIFTAYFQRGYRAVDFFLARGAGRGQYLLSPRS